MVMEFKKVNGNLWMLGDRQIDPATSGILLLDIFFPMTILFFHQTKHWGFYSLTL